MKRVSCPRALTSGCRSRFSMLELVRPEVLTSLVPLPTDVTLHVRPNISSIRLDTEEPASIMHLHVEWWRSCQASLDVKSLWMSSLSGCQASLDVKPLWMSRPSRMYTSKPLILFLIFSVIIVVHDKMSHTNMPVHDVSDLGGLHARPGFYVFCRFFVGT